MKFNSTEYNKGIKDSIDLIKLHFGQTDEALVIVSKLKELLKEIR